MVKIRNCSSFFLSFFLLLSSFFSSQPSALNARSYTFKTAIDCEKFPKDGPFVLSLKHNYSLMLSIFQRSLKQCATIIDVWSCFHQCINGIINHRCMGGANNKYCATILCTVFKKCRNKKFKRFLKRNPVDVGMDGWRHQLTKCTNKECTFHKHCYISHSHVDK